jgi:hypothetical protein
MTAGVFPAMALRRTQFQVGVQHFCLNPCFGSGVQVRGAARVAAADGKRDAAMDSAAVGSLAELQRLHASDNRAAPAKIAARWAVGRMTVDRHQSSAAHVALKGFTVN